MKTLSPKSTQEGRNRTNSNERAQQQDSQGLSVSPPEASLSDFEYNRPEAVAQRELQEAINDSPQIKQAVYYQKMANDGPQVRRLAQMQEMIDNSPRMVAQRKQMEGIVGRAVQKKENKTGLPDKLKAGIETLSGLSMDDVKAHYHSAKPAQLQALAYTQGQDIYVGPGQEQHLPHEGWHTVQQMQGRVKPTMQAQGVSLNEDEGLEHEADVMATKALKMRRPDQVATGPISQATTAEPREKEPTEASEVHSAADGASGDKVRLNFLSTDRRGEGMSDTISPGFESAHPVIQRRVALAKESPSENFVELTSINYAIKRAGGPVKLLKDSDFSSMQSDEILFIVAHGSVGSSGDYSANQIADFLTDEHKGLQNSIKGIIFTSCYAGKGEVMYDESDSVVGILSNRLTDAGFGGVTVIGARGPSIKTDEMVGNYTVWDKSKKVTLECQAMGRSFNLPAVQVVEKVLTILMDPQGSATKAIASLDVDASMKKKAEAASKATGKFYEKLVHTIEAPRKALGIVDQITDEVALKLNTGWKIQVTKEEIKDAVTNALTTWDTLELEEQRLAASTSLTGFGPQK